MLTVIQGKIFDWTNGTIDRMIDIMLKITDQTSGYDL